MWLSNVTQRCALHYRPWWACRARCPACWTTFWSEIYANSKVVTIFHPTNPCLLSKNTRLTRQSLALAKHGNRLERAKQSFDKFPHWKQSCIFETGPSSSAITECLAGQLSDLLERVELLLWMWGPLAQLQQIVQNNSDSEPSEQQE